MEQHGGQVVEVEVDAVVLFVDDGVVVENFLWFHGSFVFSFVSFVSFISFISSISSARTRMPL